MSGNAAPTWRSSFPLAHRAMVAGDTFTVGAYFLIASRWSFASGVSVAVAGALAWMPYSPSRFGSSAVWASVASPAVMSCGR